MGARGRDGYVSNGMVHPGGDVVKPQNGSGIAKYETDFGTRSASTLEAAEWVQGHSAYDAPQTLFGNERAS
jgi:hypothetical protein